MEDRRTNAFTGQGELLRRQQVLAQFGEFVLDHDDIDEVLNEACRLIARALGADLAKVIEIESETRQGFVRAGVGWDPGVVGSVRIDLDQHSSEAYAIALREPVIANDIAKEKRFHFPQFLKEHDVVALINVPIMLPGRIPYGILQVDSRQLRHFDDEDVDFLKTYAMTLGPVIDRLNSVTALRETDKRQAFLLKLSDALRPLADPVEIQTVAARLIGEQLGASRVFYVNVESDGDTAIIHDNYVDGVPVRAGRYSLSAFSAAALKEWQAGNIAASSDVDADPRYSEAERAAYASVSTRAGFGVPLVKHGKLVAILGVNQSTPRNWTDQEIDLSREAAERVWNSVERARAEAALRESQRLQSAMLSVIPVGLGLCDAEGKVVISNPEWERFVPTRTVPSNDPSRGSRWESWDSDGNPIDPSDFPAARALRGESVEPPMEFIYTDDNGRECWTGVAALPLTDDEGTVVGAVSIIQDIDVAKRSSEALRESKDRQSFFLKLSDALRPMQEAVEIQNTAMRLLAEQLAVARAGYYEIAADQDSFSLKARWERDTPSLPDKLKMSDFGPDVRDGYCAGRTLVSRDIEQQSPSATGRAMYRAIGARARIGVPLVKEGRLLTVVAVHSTPPRDGTAAEIRLVEDVKERTWEAVERARAENALRESDRHQGLLLAELQHRVRNTLAVVRSIARRTAENSDSVEDMLFHFQGRIDAFSRVQSALARRPDARVDLASLIEDELVAHATKEGPQVSIAGPDVALGAREAERISLGIHELTTNAVKHGALCSADGRLSIDWRLEEADDNRALRLFWKETGADVREPISHEGFGMALLRRSLPYDLQGETEVELAPDGLRFELRMPLPVVNG